MAPSSDPTHGRAGRYTRTAIVLHWLLAFAILGQMALGWWMLDLPKSPPGLRAGWFNFHKSIGLTIAALVLMRIAWRVTHAPPLLPLLPPWQHRLARINHLLMYCCMVLMPLSGYLGSTFTRYPVRYFGVVVPSWNIEWPAGKELMSGVHQVTVWLFMGLIALHVAAALWHWRKGDGIIHRMGLQ